VLVVAAVGPAAVVVVPVAVAVAVAAALPAPVVVAVGPPATSLPATIRAVASASPSGATSPLAAKVGW
jgi:hypothetical protein